MENASKALAMAGGLLLAIIIIAVLMYVVQNTASLKKAEEDKEIAEQITKFNMEYESYEKTLLRGTELVTLINKAIANNTKYEEIDPTKLCKPIPSAPKTLAVYGAVMSGVINVNS